MSVRATPRMSRRRVLALGAAVAAVALVVLTSLALGSRGIAPDTVLRALFSSGGGYDAAVVLTDRLPRTVLGLLIGAALGAAGAVMQGLTRNPLADPGILGVQHGAACGVVFGLLFLGVTDLTGYFWLALAGSAVATLLVYGVANRANATDAGLSLVLAGAALSALFASVLTLVLVRDQTLYAHYRFWTVGQLTGRADVLAELSLLAAPGLVAALFAGRYLDILTLGDDAARGLGVHPGRARWAIAAIGVYLCAVATAGTGPIAFVGLIGAHLARLLAGPGYRWLVPLSMACGAVVLLGADTVGRLAPGNGEIEAGITAAVVGAPFFLVLAKTRRAVRL
ncbi:FecCD family ABC transporter permease [Amycolatopsis umgeniensis]|uniref:Iron complex transport system permease protein n=1 Tax=Amycolatopsis umgeniensis TaxID=336628 RepID=A0A841AVH2_9PSEU|nr:iron ABC transporter permease [Amycolatopsis umgeniensis]MBB5850510.1 iron complex transport system permease protein [Amycolatopsis umgeniensis]